MKRYTLSKKERLKLKKDFERVYTKGSQLFSSQKKLKVNYYLESSVNDKGIKAAFVVSKKAGKAVWRNRIRRLLKEAYRTNKIDLTDFCINNNFLLYLVFSPRTLNQKQNKKIKLSFILDDLVDLLNKVKNQIQQHA
ncbi:MAG: ribonuclease P protein component [Ignavibacteriales bacterium]|nr:ribonuclease P protein component [Ignavibacteriota bacterium]MCB9249695.1 ribonuclease P protein component [Ignavibacteriales bacterium]